MTDPAEAWLTYLQVERNYTANTIATYRRTLATFPHAATATREDVEAWWRTRAHHTPATRNNELSALRSFYKWAIRWEVRGDDPTLRIDGLKQDRGLPRPVSRADLHKLLGSLRDDMRRAVALGAWAGLRVSETAALDWADVDQENNRIRVQAKRKTRLVGMSPILLDSLLPDTGGNVVTAGGRPLAAATLTRKVNRAIQRAGVDATYHQLRHRFGTMALATSGNLLAVSRAMGHTSPSTTAIYSATSDAELDVIAEGVTR